VVSVAGVRVVEFGTNRLIKLVLFVYRCLHSAAPVYLVSFNIGREGDDSSVPLSVALWTYRTQE